MSVSWPKKVDEHLGEIAAQLDDDPEASEEEEAPIDEILEIEGMGRHFRRIADRIDRVVDPAGLNKAPPPPPDQEPSPPNPPPSPGTNIPRHQELAYLLSRFYLDNETAKELGFNDKDPMQGTTAWAFPRWHIAKGELAIYETLAYPYRFDSSRLPSYETRTPPPLDGGLPQKPWPPEWELSPKELAARGLATLAQRQAGYYVARGWVTPFVRRLSSSDPIVVGVKAARAMLPKIPFGPKTRMKWCNGKGWMYTTEPADPYLKWLYAQWALPWLDATEAGTADVHAKMAAMATMFQEAHPSSINTYDGCVFSYGIGFAIGAPQIVCKIIENKNIRKLLYLAGVHITPRALPGGGNIYDVQMVELFDEQSPNVQAWEYGHHWYGFMRAGSGVSTMAPSGKGKIGNDPAFAETFQVSTDNALIAKKVGKSTDSTFPDAPLSSGENYYNAYQRLSNDKAREMEVLSAFIAVAEDELTRAAVNEVNQVKITARATIPDTVCKVYTEAGYTFVSMCVHNWAIPISQPGPNAKGPQKIWLGQLLPPAGSSGPYLRKKDADAVRAIRAVIGPRQDKPYSKITWSTKPLNNPANVGPNPGNGVELTDAMLDELIARGGPVDADAWWELAAVHDALIAKAVARLVMSLLEWNRYLTGIKECAKKIAAKKDPPTIGMWDEKIRSYNWGWRFKRLREYWLRMTNGHNYYQPLVAVVKGSGLDVNEVGAGGVRRWAKANALIAPRGVRYMVFPDFDISTPHARIEDILTPNALAYPAIRGNEFGDGAVEQDYYELGPFSLLRVPTLMYKYGRNFEIVSATVDQYQRPLTATVRLLGGTTTLTCDALGDVSDVGVPLTEGFEPEWPEAVPPPNWLPRYEPEPG